MIVSDDRGAFIAEHVRLRYQCSGAKICCIIRCTQIDNGVIPSALVPFVVYIVQLCFVLCSSACFRGGDLRFAPASLLGGGTVNKK